MNESGFDDLFTDLIEGCEELQLFLDRVRDGIPAAAVQLYTAEGRLLPREAEPWLTAEQLPSLRKARECGALLLSEPRNVYAISVPQLKAVLLLRLSSSGELAIQPAWRSLIRASVELALLRQEHEILGLENQQIKRQIGVLNQQHHKLIEDNYRQYRLLREREREYARKLEKEIDRQTTELRNANARLEESSRLKSEFLANMSHELRTPLNAIIGFSELLADSGLHGEQVEFSNTIRAAGSSLLALINDILDLSKIEAGKIDLESEPLSLAEMISRVQKLFESTAREKGVAFFSSVDDLLPEMVRGDANRLQQILVNLAGNAVKFTNSGTVELRAESVGGAGEEVSVRFTVRDTGIGIAAERQKAIFDKFVQADGSTTRKYGGTGLGLAICSQLVSLMRGEIQLESVPGQGSTFTVTVPLGRQLAPLAGRRAVQSAAPDQGASDSHRSAAVLLVEDHPVNRRLAEILLSQQNCRVLTAADGLEALEMLESHWCDLILMDIQMPRLDGLETTRKIRELETSSAGAEFAGLRKRCAPIPIIGLTAHARKEDEQASLEAGMDDFITKPINRDKLSALLSKYLCRR